MCVIIVDSFQYKVINSFSDRFQPIIIVTNMSQILTWRICNERCKDKSTWRRKRFTYLQVKYFLIVAIHCLFKTIIRVYPIWCYLLLSTKKLWRPVLRLSSKDTFSSRAFNVFCFHLYLPSYLFNLPAIYKITIAILLSTMGTDFNIVFGAGTTVTP